MGPEAEPMHNALNGLRVITPILPIKVVSSKIEPYFIPVYADLYQLMQLKPSPFYYRGFFGLIALR